MRQQIECVGIEDQGQGAFQCLFEMIGGLAALTESRAAGQGVQIGSQQLIGAAQHQFRLQQVDARCIGIEQTQIDAPGAQHQRRPRRQERRAGHGPAATEHADAAVTAFVTVAPARA